MFKYVWTITFLLLPNIFSTHLIYFTHHISKYTKPYKAFYSTSTVCNWSFILWITVTNKTARKVSTGGFASNDRCRWTKWLIEVRYPHLKLFKDHLQSYFICRIRNFQRYLVNIQSTSTVEIQMWGCLKFV